MANDTFFLGSMAFYLLYAIIGHILRFFSESRWSAVLSLLPALFIFFLIKDSSLGQEVRYAVMIAAAIRLLMVSMPQKNNVIKYGTFVLDAAALYLCFAVGSFGGEALTDKILFTFLAALSMSAVQSVYSIYYFTILAFIVLMIPMRESPLDWSFLGRIGEKAAVAARDLSYYMPYSFTGKDYSVGYSSFNVTGESIKAAEREGRTQLRLETVEKPYFIFKDEESGADMKMRRNLYLAGGRGADKEQFARFLNFLYMNGLSKKEADLFSQISKINIEYEYINTPDEIAPANSLTIESRGHRIDSGVSRGVHRKGYDISASYLDIDYGSPYLISLLGNAAKLKNAKKLSFEEASDYAKRIYAVNLINIMSKDEYETLLNEDENAQYLDKTGCSDRMKDLAVKLTEDAADEYEKCKIIEAYLRQYPYSFEASGGHDPSSDMSSAAGMADIADRFLFETEKGYCVHYTSSMVMLLRSIGIPARAEKGYHYLFPFEGADSYEVDNNCAHTWPVAYIEGFGWIPFEPTGSCLGFESSSWHRTATDTVAEKDVYSVRMKPEFMTLPEKKEGDELTEGDNKSDSIFAEAFKISYLAVAGIAVLLLLMIAGTVLIKKIRYKYGSPEEKLRTDVEEIRKKIVKKNRGDLSDRGLLSDYLAKVPDDLRTDLEVVFAAYYRSVYGNEKNAGITAKENELARKLREKIMAW